MLYLVAVVGVDEQEEVEYRWRGVFPNLSRKSLLIFLSLERLVSLLPFLLNKMLLYIYVF